MTKMKWTSGLFASLAANAILLNACVERKSNQLNATPSSKDSPLSAFDVKNADGSIIPADYSLPITCSEGFDAVSFGLQNPNTDLRLMRLDVCISQDNAIKVMRLVHKTILKSDAGGSGGGFGGGFSGGFQPSFTIPLPGASKPVFNVYAIKEGIGATKAVKEDIFHVPSKSLTVKNLDQALLEGVYTDFLLEIAGPKHKVSMRGISDGTSELVEGDDSRSGVVVEKMMLRGKFEVGDPISINALCEQGWELKDEKYVFAKAKLNFKTCYRSEGGTDFIKRVALTLEDSHEHLKGKSLNQSFDAKQIGSVVETHVAHHNTCDYLRVKMPEATYLVLHRARVDSCFDELKLEKLKDAKNTGDSIFYRIDYKGKAPVVGVGR